VAHDLWLVTSCVLLTTHYTWQVMQAFEHELVRMREFQSVRERRRTVVVERRKRRREVQANIARGTRMGKGSLGQGLCMCGRLRVF